MKKNKALCDPNNCFLIKNCLTEWLPAVLHHQKTFKVKKGETIFKEGDPVTGVFFVNSGNVKVHKRWNGEKELIIRFAKAGSILGHRGIGSEFYPISATALEAGVICYIDTEFFETTLNVNSTFTHNLLYFFGDELRESEEKMRNLAHMPVKGRVAGAIISLKNQFGLTGEGFLNIELSRQDLAAFAGATYETVFRVINELVHDGLIALYGKNISIADYDNLFKLTLQGA